MRTNTETFGTLPQRNDSSSSSRFAGLMLTMKNDFHILIVTTFFVSMFVTTVSLSNFFFHSNINGTSGPVDLKVSVQGYRYGHGSETDTEDDKVVNLLSQLALDEVSNHLLQCHAIYDNMKANQTVGLMDDDYAKSRAYHGGVHRLSLFIEKLQSGQQPVTVVTFGGSISKGTAIEPLSGLYSNAFVDWLNQYYPIKNRSMTRTTNSSKISTHRLINHAHSGADICFVAKYFNYFQIPVETDLFILEFGVNDYLGNDGNGKLHPKTEMFFDGYERISFCCEAVVRKLLSKYPNATVIFLEIRTPSITRKTAQLIHAGVAQYYQVPIISFADVVFPKYLDLLRQLNASECFSVGVNTSIQPFPFGCHECLKDHLPERHRSRGCSNVCQHVAGSSFCLPSDLPPGRTPCYTPFYAVDSTHPSWLGHQVIRDLLIELLAVTSRDICLEKTKRLANNNSALSMSQKHHVLSKLGVYASEEFLVKQTSFVSVQPAGPVHSMDVETLKVIDKSDGFSLSTGGHSSEGWHSNNMAGGEYIEFEVNLPDDNCYVVYMSAVKSYERMGTYTITMTDTTTKKETRIEVNGVWKSRISIPFDTQINTDDDVGSCTGKCKIRVLTHPQTAGRGGNQIKIMDLSVRYCQGNTSEIEHTDQADIWIPV